MKDESCALTKRPFIFVQYSEMDDGSGGGRNETIDLTTRRRGMLKSDNKDGTTTKYVSQKTEINMNHDDSSCSFICNGGQTPAEKLNSMTPQERIRGLYDLHCVSPNMSESAEYVAKKLEELEVELSKEVTTTASDMRKAYENARQNSPQYTSEMKLQMLRADRFSVSKATARMVSHFHVRQDYFGMDSLVRDLNLDDLSEADWEYVKNGYMQVLSQRDQKGRAVIILLGKLCVEASVLTTVSKK